LLPITVGGSKLCVLIADFVLCRIIHTPMSG
jgi:hypothetical protein